MIYFTSDHHFGHTNIIELAKRPFKSVEEMDEEMIRRWNSVVDETDEVYHLGDFAFNEHDPYLARLKGRKHLIVGNHDHSNRWKKARLWETINDVKYVRGYSDHPIFLSHYAHRVWKNSGHGALHFYGHSHGNLPADNLSCDVGVDCWDFMPVSLHALKVHLAAQPDRDHPDHHGRPKNKGWIYLRRIHPASPSIRSATGDVITDKDFLSPSIPEDWCIATVEWNE